jgi:peptidyl-dipeptidase Dcp
MQDNPFFAPSTLPFAFPPFDAIEHEHYRPAFDAGVDEQRAEVEAIASSPDSPTFENTVEALERSGAILRRFLNVYYNLASSMSTPQMQALETELAPLIAKHNDEILLDARLFERISAVHAGRGDGLTPEQVRVVERYHQDFVRAGAALPEADRDRLRALNVRLTELTTEFGTKVLAEANDLAVHVSDRGELAGLPDSVVEAAASAAESAGKDGYLLTIVLPTIQPALLSLENRDLRRRVHQASVSRGTRGNDNDTRDLVCRITSLRAERAALLGFSDHAAYVVDDQTAGTTNAVLSMLDEMAEPAMRNLDSERARIEELMRADGVDGPVEPWDWAYYAALDKTATYDVAGQTDSRASSFSRRLPVARRCTWLTLDSVTPRTWPISARVSPSK